MVDKKIGVMRICAFLSMVSLILAQGASAAVIASVDRSSVELNESFTLNIVVDTAIDTEPDASALEEDFYVGTRSQVSNTTIVNGQISRTRKWTYVMMAKREGSLVIPSVRVGTEQSEPVPITVSPPSNALPGEADIFVTAEVDYDESFVQSQILYTVKVYRSVATRQPRLSEPSIQGVEVLVEVAGDERSYESILNDKPYSVVERVYALFPQESGQISIAPARFEARVLRDGRITGRKIFDSEAVEIQVNPIPPPPDGYENAAWFPARSVSISEDWSREPGELPAGEPITRHITVSALGQLSTQIPVIEPVVADTIKTYPDKPEFRDTAESSGIRASRRDQYALIGVAAGDVELAALELPWWNIDTGEWQIASLPARTLSILPSPNAVLPPAVTVEPEGEETTETSAEAGSATVVQSTFWRRVSEILVGVWLLTVLAWWWSMRRPASEPKEPEPPPIHKQQTRLLKVARKAALAGDAAALKTALLQWGKLEWPERPPRSIGAIANQVSIPLSTHLNQLCSSSYGASNDLWDGEALAKALRSFSVLSVDSAEKATDVLPPLAPVTESPSHI